MIGNGLLHFGETIQEALKYKTLEDAQAMKKKLFGNEEQFEILEIQTRYNVFKV